MRRAGATIVAPAAANNNAAINRFIESAFLP
jgi:hypothetical protein